MTHQKGYDMKKLINLKEKFGLMNYEEDKILIILCFSIIYKQILFNVDVLNKFYKRDIVLELLIFLVLYYVINAIFQRSSLWIMYGILVFISLLMLANSIYYKVYENFINIGTVTEIRMVSKVSSSVGAYFNSIYIFYLLDLFIIFIVVSKYYHKKYFDENKINMYIKTILIIILCSLALIYTAKKYPKIASIEWSKHDLFATYGFIISTALDNFNYAKNNFNQNAKIDDSKKQLIASNFKTGNVQLLNYKGKNLIMIQVESLQQFVLNRKYNGREITPNLNKLLNESMYYDNCYYQISMGHTSDAELLTNTSLYPLCDSSVYMTKYKNKYIALPEVLKSINYTSFAIHGNESSFWNRNYMYKDYGFHDFYSLEKLKSDDIVEMGLSDKSLFEQGYNIISKSKQPFYSFIVTLTSHSPFNVDNNFCNADNLLTAYYNSINYTDKYIGKFIDELKASGILDNSILIIYGDHNAMTINEKNLMENELGVNLDSNYEWQKYQKVPIIMKLPDSNYIGINHNSVGQNDIFPTILDLYGITGVKHFGKSLLSIDNNQVILRDGSYIEGQYYYDREVNETFNIDNGKIQKNDNKKIENAKKKIEASNDIINYNYFKTNN